MHEMSIAQGILDIALEAAEKNGGGKIIRIKLQVGEMTGVVPDSLTFCFGALAAGTAAAEAELLIEVLPLVAQCQCCNYQFSVERYRFFCPRCESADVKTLSGRELSVEHLEVE